MDLLFTLQDNNPHDTDPIVCCKGNMLSTGAIHCFGRLQASWMISDNPVLIPLATAAALPCLPSVSRLPGGNRRYNTDSHFIRPPFRELLNGSRVIGDLIKSSDGGYAPAPICVATDATEEWWPDPDRALPATYPYGPNCNASKVRNFGVDYCDPGSPLVGPTFGVPRFFCWPPLSTQRGGTLSMVPPWLLPQGALPKDTVPGVWSSAQVSGPGAGSPCSPRIPCEAVVNPATPYNTALYYGTNFGWSKGVTHPPSHYQPQGTIIKMVSNHHGSCALVANPNLPVLCWEGGGDVRRSNPAEFAAIGYQELFSPPSWFSTCRVHHLTAGDDFFCASTNNATARVACWGGRWRNVAEPTSTSRPSTRYAVPPYDRYHYEPPSIVTDMPDFTGMNVLSLSTRATTVCATTDAATLPIKCWADNDYQEAGGSQGEQAIPDGVNVQGAIVNDGQFGYGNDRFCAITACTGHGALEPGELLGKVACSIIRGLFHSKSEPQMSLPLDAELDDAQVRGMIAVLTFPSPLFLPPDPRVGNSSCVCHPGRGGRFCQYSSATSIMSPSGDFVRCLDGRAGSLCQYSDAETCNGEGTVDSTGGCTCRAGGQFIGAACDEFYPAGDWWQTYDRVCGPCVDYLGHAARDGRIDLDTFANCTSCKCADPRPVRALLFRLVCTPSRGDALSRFSVRSREGVPHKAWPPSVRASGHWRFGARVFIHLYIIAGSIYTRRLRPSDWRQSTHTQLQLPGVWMAELQYGRRRGKLGG